jgi:hypothetical protein
MRICPHPAGCECALAPPRSGFRGSGGAVRYRSGNRSAAGGWPVTGKRPRPRLKAALATPVGVYPGLGGKEETVTGERRWWKVTRTPRQALWLGTAWAVLGAAELTVLLILGIQLIMLITAIWFLIFGAYYLTSYALMRRHGWTGTCSR